jgi:hypothetical protein
LSVALSVVSANRSMHRGLSSLLADKERVDAEEIKRGVEGLVVPEAMRDFVLRGVMPAATTPLTQGPT